VCTLLLCLCVCALVRVFAEQQPQLKNCETFSLAEPKRRKFFLSFHITSTEKKKKFLLSRAMLSNVPSHPPPL
jgi:hypothetical protein